MTPPVVVSEKEEEDVKRCAARTAMALLAREEVEWFDTGGGREGGGTEGGEEDEVEPYDGGEEDGIFARVCIWLPNQGRFVRNYCCTVLKSRGV